MLHKQDYINKAKDLLADKDTGDPTASHKNKPIQILRTIKDEGGQNNAYEGPYPTSAVSSQMLWTP